MAKKNKKTSLLTKQLEIRDDIPQLITATAIEHFPLLKKANIDIYLQIAILKEYTDRYYLEKIYYNEALPAIESDPKLAKELKRFLSKVHDFCTTEACGSKEENQARLQKIRDRRFTEVSLDKFKGFKTTVNKYSAFINLKSLFSDLDDEIIALDTTKRIFVLFNLALPYYSNEIRGCFDLEQLFVKFEKIRSAFFENLTLLLSKQPEPTHPEFFFLKQVQVYGLCAAMMCINHAKILNSDLDPAIFFVLNTLSDLLPHRLKAFMFADYVLEETDIIAILPSPLNMIAVLIEHYQNEKDQRSEENEKLDHLLTSLQTIKKRFIDKMQGNFLQDSLMQEFIFFLDRLLNFVLSTNQTGYSKKILEYYNGFLPLIDELIKLFEDSSQTDRLHCLKSIKTKWDNFINENNLAHQTSEQKGSELIHEQQQIKAQLQQQQLAKAQVIQAKANENAARRLAEKKQKQFQEAAISAMKRQERLAETPLSPLDHAQNQLQCKIALLEQNVSTDEKFKIKEKISREEICRCLKIDPIEKIDENSLIVLKAHIITTEEQLSSNARHTLLILCISLADNYLSRITHSISYYKKHYAPSLKRMTDRHGQRDFGKSDHKAYQEIKGFMEPALENLMLTANDCECLLTLFEMIACLRQKIENKEFYRLWNFAAAFRKEEHKDLYKNFLKNLEQLKTYRESKKIAFKALPKNNKSSSLNNSVKLDGKMIAESLESLITAIKKITEILAKNDEGMGYLVNVSLLKEDQFRKAQLQTAAINKNKIRKPIEYNRYECFRRSQSFHKSGLTDNDRPEQANITYVSSRRLSI